MSLSQEQVQELDKYQNKFLSGEITAQEYEFAKKDILDWKTETPSNKPKKQSELMIKTMKKNRVKKVILG